MNSMFRAFLSLAVSVSISAGAVPAEPDTLAQQYSALLEEYHPVAGGMRTATSDSQRKSTVEALAAFAPKFLDLAEKDPQDPIALTALRQAIQADVSADSAAQNAWEMNRAEFPAGSIDGTAARCVELLLRDHLLTAELGPVVDRMRYGYRLEYDRALTSVLEKSPHREIRGLACLALAQFLSDRLRMLQLVEDRPELVECYHIVFGKDYLSQLKRLDQAVLAARMEALLERAVSEYEDVKFRSGTVGETATAELYDIRHLRIGRVAPDIVGIDQDGISLKLSDYRGDVVLLYFWSEY